MTLNKKNSLLAPVLLLVLFIVFTLAVEYVDVRPIGPMHTEVGLGGINSFFASAIGTNMIFYDITNILGYLAILIVGFFAIVGIIQLVVRKSLLKVDRDVILLGVFYVLVMACYVLFDKFAVNYRPVIFDEGLEASYPSSHTMLAVCVFCTGALQVKWKMRDEFVSSIVRVVLYVFAAVTVVFRLLSGVHWFTDIIGGVILSAFLVSLYIWFVNEVGGPGHKQVSSKGKNRRNKRRA